MHSTVTNYSIYSDKLQVSFKCLIHLLHSCTTGRLQVCFLALLLFMSLSELTTVSIPDFYKLNFGQVSTRTSINFQYSVAQLCTCEDTLAHNLGALYFGDFMSYNSLTTQLMINFLPFEYQKIL